MKHLIKTMAFTLLGLVLSMNLMAEITSPWSYTFVSPDAISSNSITKNGVTWSVATTEGAGSPAISTGSYSSTYGLKFGNSKSVYFGSVTFSTDAFKDYNVTAVTVKFLNNGSKEGTFTVKQGDVTLGSASQTFGQTWTELTVNDKTTSYKKGQGGTLSFTYSVEQAFYINKITVTFEEGSTPDPECASEVNVNKGTITGTGCDIEISDEKVCADGDGGSVTVTPSPAAHYHCTGVNATVGSVTGPVAGVYTVSGITDETTISASFAEDDFATISWSVNGNPVTGGSTKVYVGAKVSSLPTDPDAPTSCDEKVFVGWTNAPVTDGEEPDILFTAAADAPAITSTGTVTYYAVFADEEAGGTTSVTKDIIAEAGVTASQTLNGTAYQIGDLPIQLTATKGTSNWPVINYNATNGNDLRFYKSSSSVTFATTNSQPITKIEFKKNSTTSSNLNTYFSANVGTLSSNVWTGSSTSVTITFSNTDNYKEQMYIVNVTYSATGGKTYSDYVTSCVVDDRTPVKMTGFTADETTLLKGATTNTYVTNDQVGWTAAYIYSSDNEDVATVNESGVITAVAKGTATITATLNVSEEDLSYKADKENKSKSIEITVNNPKHTMHFFVNGTELTGLEESISSQEEGAALVCPANPADIGSKVFVGWKLGEISGSTDDKPELVSSSTLVGNAEQNYHAVFATKGVSTSDYVKGSLSDLTTGQKVVIVEYTDNMALTSTATDDTYNLKNKSVTINNNKISSVAGELVWDVTKINDSKYQFKQGDSFLYGYNDGQNHYNLKFGSTSDSWTIASGGTGYTLESGLCSGYKLEYFSSKFTIYKKDALDKAFYMDFYIPDVAYSAYVTTIASEYAITVDGSIANGSVEASAASATAGSTIELTATPASDAYDFEAWNVYKTGEPATTVEVIDGKFTMPNYAVTVSATFKATDRALITWESFGTQFAQTYVSREGKIQMPTGTPTNESGCGSKYQYFMGWSTAIEGVATEAPTYITAETAAPTENTTYYAVFAKGQEGETVKELTFPDDNKESNKKTAYTDWDAKIGDDTWKVVKFNNNNWSWGNARCGSKSADATASIATDFAISAPIKKVVVNALLAEDKLNSATLYISSTNDFASVEAVASTIAKAETAADYEFVIPTPAANKYYKLTFDCAKGTNNGFLQINSIAYKTADIYEGYATTCPSAYAITVSQPEQGGSIGASVTSAEAGETITLTANPAAGYTTGTWDVYKTGESATKETVTGNAFTMPAYPVTVEYAFTEIKVTSITLNKTEYTMDANSSFQLKVTEILPADALNKEVEWSTSDASIATVSETGFVSGVTASATPVVITATSKSDNTVTATCSFTITDPIVWNLTGITVTKPTTTTFAEGAEFTDASLTGMVVMGLYENSIDPANTKDEPITEGYTVKIGEHALPYTISHEDALARTMKVTVTYNEMSDDFDLTLVPTYKTTWKVNGTAQTGVAYPATANTENKISLPTATAEALIALFGDDQYQFFRGWATAELEEEATSETGIVYAQAGDEISEDKTYYAVFAKGEMAEGWNINTEAPAASESVVLAAKDNGTYYAFTADGSASSPVALTVEDGKITSESPFAWSIAVENNIMYLKQGEKYVHFNSNSDIKVANSTSNGDVVFAKSGEGFTMTGHNHVISFNNALDSKKFYYGSSDEAAIFYVFKKDATTLTSFLTTKCDNKVPAPTVETVKTPTTITLNWGAVDGIESWNVTFDGETTTVNTNTYKATGLEMESEHSYKVVAVPAGEYCGAIATSGSVSTIACNTPTPENLSETDITATTATLNWEAIEGASKYEVVVSDGDNDLNMFVPTNSYEVTGLTPNTKYTWSVKAFVECWGDANEDGEFTTLATVDKFNLTLNATNGEISSTPEAGLVEEGEDVVMEAINPATGYMFGSWSYTGLTEADVEIDENTLAFTMPHGDVTVTANFIEIPTITWKVCGETVATTPATNGKVGTVQDAPADWKYKTYFPEFAGWVTSDKCDAEGNVETAEFVSATTEVPAEGLTVYGAVAKSSAPDCSTATKITSNENLDMSALYVIGAEYDKTTLYYKGIDGTWGKMTSDVAQDAPMAISISGTASALALIQSDGKYIEPCTSNSFAVSDEQKLVVMNENGDLTYNSNRLLTYNHNSGNGGIRWYGSTSSNPKAYLYKVALAYENLTINPQPDYGRTDLVVGNYGTVCVPYAVKVADRSGATFWNIETSNAPGSTNPTSVTIVEETEDLVAGKPYIFCATDTKMALFFSDDKYEGTESVEANGLYGNLTDGTITINQTEYEPGYFFVLQQKLYECGVNCTVAPNRGWVQANQIEDKTTPSLAPRRVIGNPNVAPTGIDNLNGEGWVEMTGAHKYFRNGTIMIVNDGHIYNAQGVKIQ